VSIYWRRWCEYVFMTTRHGVERLDDEDYCRIKAVAGNISVWNSMILLCDIATRGDIMSAVFDLRSMSSCSPG
jgi:hypothetical protein